ncbi:MAG: hypothetical protein KUG78_08025 [Kangiellaceae bacterium]|nr:hypothetical protein [Kangiellaceae bacterium]
MNDSNDKQQSAKLSHKQTESLDDLKTEIEQLFSNAKRTIQIYSRDLDPRILDHRTIAAQLMRFVRLSRFTKVQILIFDENLMKGRDHSLLNLAQRFTSHIEIRVVPKDYQENRFGYYLADNRHIIYRNNIERYEAEITELPHHLAIEKNKSFHKIWDVSTPASSLRALHI